MSKRRIGALVVHYLNSLRHNKARLIEVFFIPIFEILAIGYLSRFVDANTNATIRLATVLLTCVIFWHLLVRLSAEVSQQFFDDFLTRNLIHLLAAPITIFELLTSLYLAALFKLSLSIIVILGIVHFFYGQNLGHAPPVELILAASLVLFIWGLALGTWASSFFFILGNKAGMISWGFLAIIQPFSGVYYDSSILPPALETASRFMPSLYIFDSLRAYYADQPIDFSALGLALALSLLYLLSGIFVFGHLYAHARKNGFLARQ